MLEQEEEKALGLHVLDQHHTVCTTGTEPTAADMCTFLLLGEEETQDEAEARLMAELQMLEQEEEKALVAELQQAEEREARDSSSSQGQVTNTQEINGMAARGQQQQRAAAEAKRRREAKRAAKRGAPPPAEEREEIDDDGPILIPIEPIGQSPPNSQNGSPMEPSPYLLSVVAPVFVSQF